jgi:hypothetical protein
MRVSIFAGAKKVQKSAQEYEKKGNRGYGTGLSEPMSPEGRKAGASSRTPDGVFYKVNCTRG